MVRLFAGVDARCGMGGKACRVLGVQWVCGAVRFGGGGMVVRGSSGGGRLAVAMEWWACGVAFLLVFFVCA